MLPLVCVGETVSADVVTSTKLFSMKIMKISSLTLV